MSEAPTARYPGLPAGLSERIEKLPQEPGVYIMKNRRGEVIYVGKAVNLRSRVRSYFTGTDTRAFVALLGRLLGDIETFLVRSEKEALLLEQTLIKQHQPRFNVVHRDDKSFITLMVNTRHAWPRVEVGRTHQLQQQGAQPGFRYFGPYSSASAVRQTLRVLNQHFLLRTCTDHVLENRTRPCLEYQIGRCLAPCVFDIPPAEYSQHVDDALMFLSGRVDQLIDGLHTRMGDASKDLRFEEAARLRDQIRDVERTTEKQVVSDSDGDDLDIIGVARRGPSLALALLCVRQGRMVSKDVTIHADAEWPDEELLLQTLDARYGGADATELPDQILLSLDLPEDELMVRQAHLTDVRGKRVLLLVPQRGDKKRIVEIAHKNADAALEEIERKEATRKNELQRLQDRLHLGRRPTVMECFDVSLFQGSQPVASQVTFREGAPDKNQYRRYTVKTVTGTDDFSMMHEIITRRLMRGLNDGVWPDLLVVDGGRGQLNAAQAAFKDLGIPCSAAEAQTLNAQKDENGESKWKDPNLWIELCSLAKARSLGAEDRRGYAGRKFVTEDANEKWEEGGQEGGVAHSPERVFLPNVKDPIALRANSAELHLMTRIRDEAHRFAITFHRARRKKASFMSALDQIEGVGPARRRALLRHFGSLAAVKDADVEALAKAPGVSKNLAQRIHDALHRETNEAEPEPPVVEG